MRAQYSVQHFGADHGMCMSVSVGICSFTEIHTYAYTRCLSYTNITLYKGKTTALEVSHFEKGCPVGPKEVFLG